MPVATQTIRDLLQHLRTGTWGQVDSDFLEQYSAADLVAELRLISPYTFQERRIGNKWEISLARGLRTELSTRHIRDSVLVSLAVVPVYLDCVMLNVEDDHVNGISRFRRLRVRSVGKPTPGLVLTMSRGFKFDLAPDGWAMKPLKKRTVRLPESFLNDRGWQFHHLGQFIPSP